MKHALVIAHPKAESFTHAMADAHAAAVRSQVRATALKHFRQAA